MTRTVMIYDGQCGLCLFSMKWVSRLDWLNRIELLDAQGWAAVHERFPALGRTEILGLIHVIAVDGQILRGYEGIRYLSRQLPLAAWAYIALHLPGISWIGPRVYGWVAANRHRFGFLWPDPCKDGRCQLPVPD